MLILRTDTRPRLLCAAGALLVAAVFLHSCEPALGCGPGRMYAKRRSPRKLNALVFKQHVPNVSENTLGASGLPEGKITRDHPKFKELVPNYNADIIFKDEEGTGADRLMTQRCKEKLNTLAISVMNMWPGVRLRVTEAYDEEGYHARNSLHEEGRAVDLTTSDRDRSKYGMLARLAVEAGFDFVYYESRSHIHCSVKSESADASRGGGCFKGDSLVHTPDGRRRMSELRIGDHVMVSRADGTLGYSEVILFLDRDGDQQRLFNTIVTEGGRAITLTPSHLIYVGSHDNGSSSKVSEAYATFAKNVEVGDYVYVRNTSGDVRDTSSDVRDTSGDVRDTSSDVRDTSSDVRDSPGDVRLERVVDVRSGSHRGSFAPLTREGNIVVDDVLASCYALLDDQDIAHMAFMPVRFVTGVEHALRNLHRHFVKLRDSVTNSVSRFVPDAFAANARRALKHFLQKLPSVQLRTWRSLSSPQKGIHWYPRLLYKVTYHLLPHDLLYL